MSKFKAVPTRTLPKLFLDYLDSEEFAVLLLTTVLGGQMHVENPTSRPAGHYVQEADCSIEVDGRWGVELTLSKISVMDGRYFQGALEEMERILTTAVERFVPRGRTVDIFCVIATDQPVYNTDSTLFEMKREVTVEGQALL